MTNENKPILTNQAYNVAKDASTIYLPALGVFYAAIAGIWGLPFATEVVGTLAALAALLGALIKISTAQYNNSPEKFDGTVLVDKTGPVETVQVAELTTPVEELPEKGEVVLKVEEPFDPEHLNGK